MALAITVNGGGTFTASMEEGPVSFTASLGAVPGPKGDTGATGPAGVVAATAPITYDSGTQTVGISATPTFTSVTATTGNLTTVNLTTATFADATSQTTAFVGEARKVYVTARNNTGSTIAAGKVVYLSGATGNKPTIALAQADAEATSARVIGLTVESIANNADGKVIISGSAENIDTSAFSAGDVVYLSATTAGGMTTTLPTQPFHGVAIGIITRANPSVGSVEVGINNYQELEELSDVLINGKANLDLLSWDSASSTWKNKTFAALGLLTSATAASTYLAKASNLSDLASASTARTNLGLGTMATETATDYLTKAGNLSGLASNATARTNLDVYSKSESDALVPAASTSTAGKVELATVAEALTKTSTTLAVTPSNMAQLLVHANVTRFNSITMDTATSGTGGTNATEGGGLGRQLYGPTSSGAGHVRAGMLVIPIRGGSASSGINWSRYIRFSARVVRDAATISNDSIYRLVLGEPQGTNTGDIPNRGIGIKVTGSGVMQLMVHDGTTLTTVNTTHTPSNLQSFDLMLISDGAGNVEAFVNGSSVGSTTGGPTGAASTSQNYMNVRIENTSSFTANRSGYRTYNICADIVYT